MTPNTFPISKSAVLRRVRDAAALTVVAIFMFPLFWWALTSIKPVSAVLTRHAIIWFDFDATWDNYAVTFLGAGPGFFDSRKTLFDSIIVACGSTLLTLALALAAGFALSHFTFKARRSYFAWVVFHRILPPIVVVIPLVVTYRTAGLFDTLAGVILAHAAMNLPFSILLLTSFFDDVPREVSEAAMIDGATLTQVFCRVLVPMIRGGIAAAAVLCFIFSWTEFLMSLFLTSTIRLLPIQASLVTTFTWGFTAALSTAAIVPSFIFILLTQKHLVRGLTMGAQKG